MGVLLGLMTLLILPSTYVAFAPSVLWGAYAATWQRKGAAALTAEATPVLTTIEWLWALTVPYILFLRAIIAQNDAPQYLLQNIIVAGAICFGGGIILWVVRAYRT